jgi:hypothetical protein
MVTPKVLVRKLVPLGEAPGLSSKMGLGFSKCQLVVLKTVSDNPDKPRSSLATI